MNDLQSSDLIVSRITVRLQKTFKWSQKLFRSIPSSTQTEFEHYRSSRSAVLPQIGLMILPAALVHLHVHYPKNKSCRCHLVWSVLLSRPAWTGASDRQ
jgi:hypothetical protein